MKTSRSLALGVVFLILAASSTFGEDYYIRAGAPGGGDGMTWATAFDSFDDITPSTSPALAAGDTIHVGAGTYPALVTAYSGVILLGSYPPTGDPGDGYRNTSLYPSIIDAAGEAVAMEVESNAILGTLIDGFIIENALNYGISNGNNSQAVFNNLILRDNGDVFAIDSGAFRNGNLAFARIFNSVFENNLSVAGGGAFRNPANSSFLIERCVFRGNYADYGGAISNAGTETYCGSPCAPTSPPCDPPCDPVTQPIPRIRLSVFENNKSDEFAGAIYNDGDLMLLACTFVGNEADTNGGAIQMNAGRLILQDTSFIGNRATGGNGGAIQIARGCLLTGHSCLFAENFASDEGGAVYALALHTSLFQNCTVTENEADTWGGFYIETIAQSCYEPGPVETRVENSILWNNLCGSSPCGNYEGQLKVVMGTTVDPAIVNYTDLEDLASSTYGTSGVGNIPDNPEFRDPVHNNWRLKGISPCIDAANGEIIPQDNDDADGDSRIICDGCTLEDTGEHLPDLDLARRIVDVLGPFATGLEPLDNCPLECDSVPDMGCHEFVACVESADCATRGDLNGDGSLNGLDVDPFTHCAVQESAGEIACLCGDFSGPAGSPDGVVDRHDVPCFIELLLTGTNGCTGPIICSAALFTLQDCNENGIPDANDIALGTSLDCNKNGVPDDCDISNETSNDVNSNDIPDECETDCNSNGVPDAWDISVETSNDVNSNGIPDECEPDCNGNDVPDAWDISTSASEDCNENGIPDECDEDCNNNDVPDDCDIANSTSEDCNENGIPDECDLSRAMRPSFDCNDNDIPDECDIANATSEDKNENGIPDECEEDSLMGGGGESMMSGGGEGEGAGFDEAAAWELFYEWYDEEVSSAESDWGTLSGSERFHRVMDELQLLGLPYAAPW